MKILFNLTWAVAVALCTMMTATKLSAAETNVVSGRVGVYDSRAVAYAWFCSDAHQHQLKELIQKARAAQAGDDTNLFQKLSGQLREHQEEMHRQVFSTAPPTEALDSLKDRWPQIAQAAGVTNMVSKWDETALAKYSTAEKTDVTDRLVHEFIQPTPKQSEVISSLEASKPLPLEQCNELIRQGKI